ncbi:helix-turn-helix domain-containing protein [Leptolyngbya sp. AN03gr2]|uniref:helix-turn-helix domain-containing protein n=1 Tax=unclassified Leptolyngbya TaxID=2650499 RepID=UPI003D31DF0B
MTADSSPSQSVTENRSQTLVPILPDIPILSSSHAGWQGILVEYYAYPAYEIPEYCFNEHKIALHTKMPDSIQVERVLDGKRQVEHPSGGEVIVVPANTPHQLCWNQPAEFMVLALDPFSLTKAAYEWIDPDRVELCPQFPTADPLIYQIGMTLKTELLCHSAQAIEPSRTDRLYIDSLTTTLSAHLLKHYTRRQSASLDSHRLPKAILNQAIDYIQEHLDQEIGLNDLANYLGFSPCYFASLFKQSTGISPHQFIIQRRLWKAKELLKTTNLSIVEIALQCGFTNQSHFAKQFRQHFSLTPSAYRQTI